MIAGELKVVNGFVPKTTKEICRILYDSAQSGTLEKTYGRFKRQYPQYKTFIDAFCSNDHISGVRPAMPTLSNLWNLNEVVRIFQRNKKFI